MSNHCDDCDPSFLDCWNDLNKCRKQPLRQTKPTYYLDASLLKESACWRKVYWTAVKGYSPRSTYVDHKIEIGNAIHVFLQHYYANVPVKECLEKAINYYRPFAETVPDSETEFRSLPYLHHVCKAYAARYNETQGDGLVADRNVAGVYETEVKFAIPVFECADFAVMLAGTIDIKGRYFEQRCIVDHKSTGTYAVNADKFFLPYDLDVQTMFYPWILRTVCPEEGLRPVLINGIFLKKPTAAAEKKGVFDGVTFQRSSLITYTETQIALFEIWLKKKVSYFIKTMQADPSLLENDLELSFCRTPYGVCKFFNVCRLPEHQTGILSSNYTVKPYEPLKFR